MGCFRLTRDTKKICIEDKFNRISPTSLSYLYFSQIVRKSGFMVITLARSLFLPGGKIEKTVKYKQQWLKVTKNIYWTPPPFTEV